MTCVGLRGILMLIGRDFYGFSRILDFGCGSARIVRWLKDLLPTSELYGTDINEEAIQWSKENVEGVQFTTNGHLPPLSIPDGSIDLVYGISVLTHLDENYQNQWLEELKRVTTPSAIVMLTVHGEEHARMVLPKSELRRLSRKGLLFHKGSGPTVDDLPDFYQVAYHTKDYIQSIWSRFFEILLYIKRGPMYQQDLVVMRRRDSTGAKSPADRAGITEIDLPLVALDVPVAGQVISNDRLTIEGWGFHPQERELELNVWLDGINVGSCSPSKARPDVADAFSGNPNADSSGFSVSIPIEELSEGPHAVWLTTGVTGIPLSSTYFLTG